MIHTRNLCFGYAEKADIFENFNLRVNKGEAWTVIGPSGCGKTTLLYLLAGLNQPMSGGVYINNEEIVRPRPLTGLVLQDHGLLPWSTIIENTRLGLKIRKFYGPDGRHSPENLRLDEDSGEDRVQYWLKWLGIDCLQNMYPSQLSRGQRQRAAIARTLILEPDLLLMDEPFSALDAPIREELQKVMNDFHQDSGLTSFTVTHDIEEAVVLGEKILVLANCRNHSATVIENPLSGKLDRRSDPEFITRCTELRDLLAEVSSKES